MVINDLGGTDAIFPADRSEFSECFVEFAGAWPSRDEQVELFAPERDAFAEQADAFNRGGRWIALEGEAQ